MRLDLISVPFQRDTNQLTASAHTGLGETVAAMWLSPSSRIRRFALQFLY